MNDLDRLKSIDLRGFLVRHYAIRVNGGGAALCPFHEDGEPSLSVTQKDGHGLFKCHGCGAAGTILDFVMKKEGLDLPSAARRIRGLEGIEEPERPARKKFEIVRVHSYTDETGAEIWQKVKIQDGSFRCRRKGPDGKWIYNLQGVRPIPYRLDRIISEPGVVICEGEKDADTLAAIGYVATSGPSGKDSWPDAITPIFAGKEVRILYDVGQDEAARAVATKISAVTENVFILKVPLEDREADVTDHLDRFEGEDAKRDAFLGILAEEERFVPEAPAKEEPLSLILSEVEARTVPWLWPGFIPIGRATLISGDPGSAKTWFSLDLAARLSRGRDWPDGAPAEGPAKTYYLTVEDDLHDTIRPRIDSLGGDPSMIAVFNSEHPLHIYLNDPSGLQRLEAEIVRIGDIRLVVVDPIIDFSGKVNPNSGEEVRALLTPLIRLAAKLNFALVLIGHLNKAQAMSAIYRAGGSTGGWLGKCRASFMIFRDKDEKALRHVIPIKANLAPQDPVQLEFRISCGRVEIEVSTEEVDPDEQLNPQPGRRPRERDGAVEWINFFFGDLTEIPAKEVEAAASRKHISPATLNRAKAIAGYHSIQRTESGGRRFWVWVRGSNA